LSGLRIKRIASFLSDRKVQRKRFTPAGCVLFVSTYVGFVLITGIPGCRERNGIGSDQGQHMSAKTIEQVQEEYTNKWMAIDGVEGTAISLHEGKPCIKIFTSVKTDEVRAKIPSTVENYPVIIEQTGQFRALNRQ